MEMNEEDQVEAVWTALFGQGPMPRDEAITTVAQALREAGAVEYARLRRDGALWATIDACIESGLKAGYIDRPRRGYVRAISVHPDSYEPQDWERALKAVMGNEPMDKDQVIRAAAEWARENMGLEFSRLRRDGKIYQNIYLLVSRRRINGF